MLQLDEARLTVVNTLDYNATVLTRLDECYECPLHILDIVPSGTNSSFTINTKWSSFIEIQAHQKVKCKKHISLTDQGDYLYHVCERACELITIDDGRPTWLPIVVALAILVILFIVYNVITATVRKRRSSRVEQTINFDEPSAASQLNAQSDSTGNRQNESTQQTGSNSIEPDNRPKRRERSLDTLRGLVICLMIFVNYGGGGFAILEHAPWYGLTIADTVFPGFIFMMGVSIVLSIRSQLSRTQNDFKKVFYRISIRSLKLFAIGLILNTDNTDLRYEKATSQQSLIIV